MSFLSNFFKVQGKNVKKALNQVIVEFDPEGATEAEIRTLEDHFNDLLVKLGNAQVELNRERQEADHAKLTYNKYMSAAEKLNAQIEAGDTSSEIAIALAEALDFLEKHVPEMEREEQEAKEAEEYFNEIKQTAEVLRDKLLSAKRSIESAKKDMDKAKMRKERAAAKAENAAALAGLRDSTSSIGEASKAMLERAEKEKAEAVALETKAQMLSGKVSGTSSTLDKLLNDKPESSGSLSDRLKSLKR